MSKSCVGWRIVRYRERSYSKIGSSTAYLYQIRVDIPNLSAACELERSFGALGVVSGGLLKRFKFSEMSRSCVGWRNVRDCKRSYSKLGEFVKMLTQILMVIIDISKVFVKHLSEVYFSVLRCLPKRLVCIPNLFSITKTEQNI